MSQLSQPSIISTPLPYRAHGLWSRVFEYHRLFLAMLLGMFIGSQGVAWANNLGWLEWRSAQLGQTKSAETDSKSIPCPVRVTPEARP